MSVLPSMDSRNIARDTNGVVYIKPMPVLSYVIGGIIGIFAVAALSRGQIVMGIAGIAAAAVTILRAANTGPSFEFDPNTRTFKAGSGPNAIAIPFDEIAGFGVSTEKERGNFTEERIMVMLKDGSGINIGVITDANAKMREEKVSNLMKFLYEVTGIVLDVNADVRSEVENK